MKLVNLFINERKLLRPLPPVSSGYQGRFQPFGNLMCKEDPGAGEIISLGRCALLMAIFRGFGVLFLFLWELELPGRGERTREALSAGLGALGLLLIILINGVAVVVVVIPGGFPGVPRCRP